MSSASKLLRYWKRMRQAEADGHLDATAQLREMIRLFLHARIGPGYYLRSGLYRREIPWERKAAHLSEKRYLALVNTLNHPAYQKISQNKLSEKCVFSALGLPTPTLIGFFGAGGRSVGGTSMSTATELETVLRGSGLRRICFKQAEGWHGRGFRAADIDCSTESILLRDVECPETELTVSEYVTEYLDPTAESYHVVEAYVDQHDVLQRLYAGCLNTVRIWIVDGKEGPVAVCAHFKLGTGSAVVDNDSTQRVMGPVDVLNGVMGLGVDGLVDRQTYTHHPDSGEPIEGTQLPFWKEAIELGKVAVAAFPGTRFGGLDIAFSKDGPLLIEMNVNPGRLGAAYGDVPSGELLRYL